MKYLIFIFLLFASCQGTELKKSVVEDQKESLELAGWSNCIRAAAKSDTRSGFNVRDCDKLVDKHLLKDDYKTCIDATDRKLACWSFYYDRGGKFPKLPKPKIKPKPKKPKTK